MATIAACLWFDGSGLETAEFCVSLFPDSHVDGVSRGPDGSPLMTSFTLMGRPFQALNGGPQVAFTEAVSLVVACDGQAGVGHAESLEALGHLRRSLECVLGRPTQATQCRPL